jgi:hypothetical protein
LRSGRKRATRWERRSLPGGQSFPSFSECGILPSFPLLPIPQPLSSLPSYEQGLYNHLAHEPLATDLPGFLADSAEERGECHRANLLHHARLALYELLRGQALTEAECREVLQCVDEIPYQISVRLARPPPNPLPDLHTPEGVQDQYEMQTLLLASYDLLEQYERVLGITGIDGRFKVLPSCEDIQARLTYLDCRHKIEQGFNQLLLVPFGIPLLPEVGRSSFVKAWQEGLKRNAHLIPDGLDDEEPVWVWDNYRNEPLVYHPHSFLPEHGGRTKPELLHGEPDRDLPPHTGWDILLVEEGLLDLPCAGQSRTIAGRSQLECGSTPNEYLARLRDPAQISGLREEGWTPETYILRFLDALERQGRVLDRETYSFLLGAFLPVYRSVPGACWGTEIRSGLLNGDRATLRRARYGTRAAVRVAL